MKLNRKYTMHQLTTLPNLTVISAKLQPFVLCIDDCNKPEQIPAEQWVQEGNIYTLIGIQAKNYFDRLKCLQLKELQPPPPFSGYSSNRFISFPFSPN
jgi:hypothetical protein